MSRNTLILLFNNIIATVLAFVLIIILSRNFGKAGLGQYTAIMAWLMLLTIITDSGVSTLITREVAQHPRLSSVYLRQAWRRRLFFLIILVPSVWLVAPILSNEPIVVAGLRVGILFVFFEANFITYTAIFRAWERMEPILILNTGYFIIQLIFMLLMIKYGGSIVHWILLMALADAIELVGAWRIWHYLEYKHGESIDIHVPVDLNKASPFLAAGLLAVLQIRIIIYLLDRFVSIDDLGLYALANRFIEATRLVPNALLGALFPRLAALVNQPAAFKRVLYLAYLAVTVYALIVVALSIVGGNWALETAFGAEFGEAAPILALLALGLVPSLLRALFTLRMYAYQQEAIVNWFLLGAIVAQFVVGWILIPAYGLIGAAWTMIVAETLLAVGLFGWMEKDLVLGLVATRRKR
ncbi:MAG: oligosaccharide flippase family protein [Anaerolineales bacterium]|nr:oligosaccharide flippase family protein [Anaerolineales bacterium]